jgi:Ca2+-binding RTX toxin-like protein
MYSWDPQQFRVSGGPGADRLVGIPGVGTNLSGGDGNDVIVRQGDGLVSAGAGNDKVYISPLWPYYYGANLTCGEGTDALIGPKTEPPPADCEKRILLPGAVGAG